MWHGNCIRCSNSLTNPRRHHNLCDVCAGYAEYRADGEKDLKILKLEREIIKLKSKVKRKLKARLKTNWFKRLIELFKELF